MLRLYMIPGANQIAARRGAHSKIGPPRVRVSSIFGLLLLATSTTAGTSDARIQELYGQARGEESRGQLNAAIETYREILKENPKLPTAHNNLGRLYFQQARYQEAIVAFQRALSIEPNLAPSRALLGIASYQIGDYKTARQELEKASLLNPSDLNVKLYLARSHFELEEFETSTQLLEGLVRQENRNTQALYTLGLAYMKLAASTLEKLQGVDPNSYLLEVLLGKTSEVKENYPEAVQHYKNAIAKAPNSQGLHYALGNVLWMSSRFPEALQEFRRELELNPHDCMANWKAASILLSENPGEAFRLADRAVRLKPDLSQALLVRGRASLASGKAESAIADFGKVVILDSSEKTVHFQLAKAYRQLGLIEQANAELAIFDQMQKRERDEIQKKVQARR